MRTIASTSPAPRRRFAPPAFLVPLIVFLAIAVFFGIGLTRDPRKIPSPLIARPVPAFTLGVAFGFGWTPCIGPVLGAIVTYSAMQGDVGSSLRLLVCYAAGLGVPFLLSAAFLRESLAKLKRFRRAGPPLQVAAGGVMVLLGFAMVTDKLSVASYWLLETFPVLGHRG